MNFGLKKGQKQLFAANGDRQTQKKLTVIRTFERKLAFEYGIQNRIETHTDTRKCDSNSRSPLPTLSQKVHGSFAFWPCSGKVWPCFGKVEALLRVKGDIQRWDPKENGDTDRYRKD